MSLMHSEHTQPSATEVDSARAYVQAWRVREGELQALRLRDVRALSEPDSARRFAQLFSGHLPELPRPGSGLVEQQKIFSRLRQTAE